MGTCKDLRCLVHTPTVISLQKTSSHELPSTITLQACRPTFCYTCLTAGIMLMLVTLVVICLTVKISSNSKPVQYDIGFTMLLEVVLQVSGIIAVVIAFLQVCISTNFFSSIISFLPFQLSLIHI